MHFSKTYTSLLVTLPSEFRDNAFEYRRLKQLIKQTASELDSLGLGPSLHWSWNSRGDLEQGLTNSEEQDNSKSDETPGLSHGHTIVYEILNSSVPEPHLRLSSGHHSNVNAHCHHAAPSSTHHVKFHTPEQSFSCIGMEALLRSPVTVTNDLELPSLNNFTELDHITDIIIPLPSDAAFIQTLTSTLSSLSGHSSALQGRFLSALSSLATSILLTARPASFSAPRSFEAYSPTADNAASLRPSSGGVSDLYTWREIFRLYAEIEVFENVRESTRGERDIEEAAKQLELFKGRVQDKRASLVLPGSKEAFDIFLNLNLFILDVKKFQIANSEATRKILKKRARRTMLPVPSYLLERIASELHSHPSKSLPRLFVQAIGEVLLPIVPHIDDYLCLICTSIAFKPVRLGCGHFFCVRCLVKMQRRGMAHCPMCRTPTVLRANPSNIDYGLLNFMADWFPIESLEKLRANEQEVTQEQLEAFGIANVKVCRIM